jgi:hypothetical protein
VGDLSLSRLLADVFLISILLLNDIVIKDYEVVDLEEIQQYDPDFLENNGSLSSPKNKQLL